jgi:PAS domain S-box-containing protein
MTQTVAATSFEGDSPVAADCDVLADRRELALVAVERTRMPMVISDPRKPDNPIVLANQAFLDLTGYAASEVLGRNCRFLQGPDTSQADIQRLRDGLARGEDRIDIELLNYRKDGSTFWNQLTISAVHGPEGETIYYFASQKDVSARRHSQKLEASERLLLMEVDHRAMNALALVQSIVRLSRADSIQTYSASIQGRVDALARAHRMLAQSNWSAADLEEIVVAESAQNPISYSGPSVRLAPRLVQPLVLVLHELFTNARQHGAWRKPGQTITIQWEARLTELALHWSEPADDTALHGAPPQGMGLTLVRGIVERQLSGRFDVRWQGQSIEADLSVPWNFAP